MGQRNMVDVRPVSTHLLFATLRLEADLPDGRTSVGTGFMIHWSTAEARRQVPVLVTSTHVVHGATSVRTRLHLGVGTGDDRHPLDDSVDVTLPPVSGWTEHPSGQDLCGYPFLAAVQAARLLGADVYWRAVPESFMASEAELTALSALERVFMVGYPSGLYDQTHNLPLLRHGYTSSHPAVDFGGEPVALADIACFPGSSGSPVFVQKQGVWSVPKGVAMGDRTHLLGVMASMLLRKETGEVKVVPIPTTTVGLTSVYSVPLNLGRYIRANELWPLRDAVFERYGLGTPGLLPVEGVPPVLE
ncbi:MAG: trypsin-like peptidase domain-containing protein [Armatimonadetes bacterium]|nr:trypsin-like peptidase domain-containing protein [Armatimonadota bacterium]